MTLNDSASALCDQALADGGLRLRMSELAGARIVDAGIDTPGSLGAGLWLARVCLGDRAVVDMQPTDLRLPGADFQVSVRTDHPVQACLGSQYAGWPVQTDDYFAMGSGPMRMCRGREAVLEALGLQESPEHVVGVLESDRRPTDAAIDRIAQDCGVTADRLTLVVAPSTSIAGTIQVVARSIETALHKLHECGFDVQRIVSAAGFAPLPPMAKPGDTVGGIGRTNDAILYGGRVTLWVDAADAAIEAILARIPSGASPDHGQPFAEIFKRYDHDFYKVDPHLFSPAVVNMISLTSGRTHAAGRIEPAILAKSFGLATTV